MRDARVAARLLDAVEVPLVPAAKTNDVVAQFWIGIGERHERNLRKRLRSGGYEELVCSDAAALPWDDQAFDLAIAYMSLQDVDDLPGVLAEIARVLEPGGRLCLAIVHPLNRPPEALADLFEEHRLAEEFEPDGLRMTFESIDRPLEA